MSGTGPKRVEVCRGEGPQTELLAFFGQIIKAISGGFIARDLQQRRLHSQVWNEALQFADPVGPEFHAALAQPPATTAGSPEDVTHEHTQGCSGPVELGCGICPADGLGQARIYQRHRVAETA